MLTLILPLTVFAMVCNSAGGGTTATTAITMLDNNTHKNCVNAGSM